MRGTHVNKAMDLFAPPSAEELAARISAEIEPADLPDTTDIDSHGADGPQPGTGSRVVGGDKDARLAAAGLQVMALRPSSQVTPTHGTAPSATQDSTISTTAGSSNPLPSPPTLPQWNPMDELWRSPRTGAGVFVGNRTAAMDDRLLARHNVGLIVVCAGEQRRHHEGDPRHEFKYMTFLVANWQRDLAKLVHQHEAPAATTAPGTAASKAGTASVGGSTTAKSTAQPTPLKTKTTADVADTSAHSGAGSAGAGGEGSEAVQVEPATTKFLERPSVFRTTARLRGEHTRHPTARATPDMVEAYFTPVFEAVDTAIEAGKSVFIHCMAGAHRAGTVGMAVVMRMSAHAPRRFVP